ncbi:MAG: hypothetical protein DWI24_10845 [Planctomycetota bacterium]|nr:MAG: hypothetical protein DWI24_10845 [Planctomycetota bacterium]
MLKWNRNRYRRIGSFIRCGFLSCLALTSSAQTEPPKLPDPARERLLMSQFEKSPDLKVSLLADSTKMSHPIAFSIDDFGRVFVAESFRYIDRKGGWSDIRYRLPWMDEDLASRSIADRKKLYESRLGDELPAWKVASERVRLLTEPDKNGVFQKSSVFADGFQGLLDGTIAGILATREKVYIANIPSLWVLDGATKEKSISRKALQTGFGVRLGYLGHDLHGLCWGPDGRLYFSMGDRGSRIEKDGKVLVDLPDTGGVFRCEADGSNIELFAKGLRNPQELTFDAFGNLWTCDNNADRGDKARWVWVLPGGDSGWRIGYQHLNKPVPLGPWTSEKTWFPAHPEQSGHIVPPVASLAQGPSGVAAHPGTGVPVSYTGQFLVCDYLGEGGGIYSVNVNRKGAGYEMQAPGKFLWKSGANDVDFAPDGSVVFCTWTGGISLDAGGGLYRVQSPGLSSDPLARSTAEILKLDPSKMEMQVLGQWLNHPDMRVRRQAQFELVKRGKNSSPIFLDCIRTSPSQLARTNSLWGLAQLQRLKNITLPDDWAAWANDTDPEFRATLARILGETKPKGADKTLIAFLKDPDQRVRLWASLALGQVKSVQAVESVAKLAVETRDQDPWLRHALAVALAGSAMGDQWKSLITNESDALRRTTLLAMSRNGMPEVSLFLNDKNPLIVADAARSVYDGRILAGQKILADYDVKTVLNSEWTDLIREAVARRWMHANLREGRRENATRLIAFAENRKFAEYLRVEALDLLNHWDKPSKFDGVQGLFYEIPAGNREPASAASELQTFAGEFLAPDQPESIQAGILAFLEKYPAQYHDQFKLILKEANRSAAIQSKVLELLVKGRDHESSLYVKEALKSPLQELKLVAIGSILSLNPVDREPVIDLIMASGTIPEKQRVISMLAEISDEKAISRLSKLLDSRIAGKIEPGLRLELNEAVHSLSQEGRGLRKRLDDQYQEELKIEPLAKWRDSISGGNIEAGKAIFLTRTDISCQRCHLPANAKERVGPSLEGVGSRLSQEELLQSIVKPNAILAKGFETSVFGLKDGTTVSGVLEQEEPARLLLRTSEGKQVALEQANIEERAKGVSLMPEGLGDRLKPRELRDLTAYLASLKAVEKAPEKAQEKAPEKSPK